MGQGLNMNEHKTLAKLQKLDSQIDALNYREKHLPEREQYLKLGEEVSKIEALFKAIDKKLRDEEKVQKRVEDELDSLTRKIDQEQNRLYSGKITNPKELSSVQQEVNHLKETADEKETALLEQIDVVDKLRSDVKVVSEQLDTRKRKLDEAKTIMDTVLAEIREERSKLQAEREPIYGALSEDTRQLYDRVRTRHLLAVTVLEEGVCQGCMVELPSTEAERIDSSVKLERCPNCSRIIVKG